MNAASLNTSAGAAFDAVAERYDELFTHSLVGRAQRDVVWEIVDGIFRPGDKILELNCGTGEDAAHLAKRGISVVACDASARMIEKSQQKLASQSSAAAASFHWLPTERICEIRFRAPFDGLFSNFSGLNCVADLRDMADQAASLLRPGARMVLCMSTRFCIWEFLVYLLQGRWTTAVRRWKGCIRASVGGSPIAVQYRTVAELKELFEPWFDLQSKVAVGLAIPPSYLEGWCREHPTVFRALVRVDGAFRTWPILRGIGDHVLLVFRRREQ